MEMIRRTLRSPRAVCALLVLHVCVLITVRAVYDADDVVNWDLVSLQNANTADSLWGLLQRPEVYFLHPFTFAQFQYGSNSVASAVMFRLFGRVSLYWSNVMVLLVYDIVFIGLLVKILSLLYSDWRSRSFAWILLSMSPVLLTFPSTSAFNMQGYIVLLSGICGAELVLRRRWITGSALIAAAFVLIAQGYNIAFFLPYFIAVWLVWRLMVGPVSGHEASSDPGVRKMLAPAIFCILYVLVLVWAVNHLSHGIYMQKIGLGGTLHKYGESSVSQIPANLGFFLRQSFWPAIKVDDVPFGFAPYFIYLTILLVLPVLLCCRRSSDAAGQPRIPGRHRVLLGVVAFGASVALVSFGYLPSFLVDVVKSQRAFMGDMFLVFVGALLFARLSPLRVVPRRLLAGLLMALLAASDIYYLSVVLSVDHSKVHDHVFDFDESDSRVRHDLIEAIRTMKQQVDRENALLVIYYSRTGLNVSENNTDPGKFYGHFLRHFGRYIDSPNLVFPYKWCDYDYGCPFPSVKDWRGYNYDAPTPYDSPESVVSAAESALKEGRKVYVWKWKDRVDTPLPFPEQRLTRIEWPAPPWLRWSMLGFDCYILSPLNADTGLAGGKGPPAAGGARVSAQPTAAKALSDQEIALSIAAGVSNRIVYVDGYHAVAPPDQVERRRSFIGKLMFRRTSVFAAAGAQATAKVAQGFVYHRDELFKSGLLVMQYGTNKREPDAEEYAVVRKYIANGGRLLLLCPAWVWEGHEKKPLSALPYAIIAHEFGLAMDTAYVMAPLKVVHPKWDFGGIEKEIEGMFSAISCNSTNATPILVGSDGKVAAVAATKGNARVVLWAQDNLLWAKTTANPKARKGIVQMVNWLLEPAHDFEASSRHSHGNQQGTRE